MIPVTEVQDVQDAPVQVPALRRKGAERAARAVLPACAATWTAAEIMHVTGIPWLDISLGTLAAAGVAYGKGARGGAGWLLAAGAWSAVAARLGPLAGPYLPLTDAWAVLSLCGWRWARRHPAVISAREKRQAGMDWLAKRKRWGLDKTHLLDWEPTRLGERYVIDTRGSGRRASQVAGSDVAERIAEDELLPPSRVRIRRHRLAGRVEISVRHTDPWAHPIPHPVLADDPEIDLSGPYSIRKPAVVGQDPETGDPLGVLLCGDGGGRNVNIVATIEGGKALALDTPLPTPTGWTTMGDVQVGDQLLGQDGRPVTVTAATSVMHGHPCYDVEFSDGTVITADAEHLWLTETRSAAQSAYRERVGRGKQRIFPAVRTTAEIAATLRYEFGGLSQSNHAIRNPRPLQLPEADLPVPPYTFGAWLGDGTSRRAEISSADPEILARIEADGVDVSKVPSGKYEYRLTLARKPGETDLRACAICGTPFRPHVVSQGTCGSACGLKWRDRGGRRSAAMCVRCDAPCTGSGSGMCRSCWAATSTLQGRLRDLDVLCNKHIPMLYMRASEGQRRALLAGLLDTDGYIGKRGGIELALTSKRLADDARQLIVSLGYSVSVTTKHVRGRTAESSTCYRIKFRAPDPVFRLSRKAERQVGTGSSGRWSRRFIIDARPVESVPVRCIQVNNSDKLYLAGPTMIPTHNTVLLSCLSERVTAARDALLIRINLSIKGDSERLMWAPACHLTALGPREKSRALKVLRVIAAIVEWRSQQPRVTADWVPSPEDPHIVLLIDEIDALTEIPACRQVLEHVNSKGREYGVTTARAGQRGTAEWTGGGNVRAVDGVFCLGKVNRSMEAMHAAGDLGLRLPDMSEYGDGHAGVWVIAEVGGAYQAGRSFKLSEPGDVARIVAERAHRQPDLKPELQAFLGETYEELLRTDVYAKWARERLGPAAVVAHPRPDAPAPEASPGAATAPVATMTGLDALDREAEDHLSSLDENDPLRQRWLAQGRRNAETRRILAETPVTPDPDVTPEQRAAHTAARWDAEAEHTAIPDDVRASLLALVAGEGISARQAVTALGVPEASRAKVTWWLNRLRWEGLVCLEGKGRGARWKLAPPPEDGDAP